MRIKATKTTDNGGKGRVFVLVAEVLLFVLVIFPTMAQVGNGYDLRWSTIDTGGGTTSTGGSYSLGGTFGQPEAGWANGGRYGLAGGFWAATTGIPSINGHVVWQGRPSQPHPLQQLPLTLTLRLDENETIEYSGASLSTDAGGYFTVSVGGLPYGTYSWRVKGPQHLANSGTIDVEGLQVGKSERSQVSESKGNNLQTITIEVGELRTGDADNDNVVDIQDFNVLKLAFGKTIGDPGYDPRADFNGDNIVDVADFNLLKRSFGQNGADPLGPSGR